MISSKQLIINCSSFETRVALIESGQVAEFYIERQSDKGVVGNIYKGKVVRVLPGMQSAFVDIGLERAAFLFVGDVYVPSEDENELPDFLSEEERQTEEEKPPRPHYKNRKIHEVLHEGEEVLVQIAKDSIGTKGARITTFLSLPGRYVVLMPNINHIGISRRIESEEERSRLKNLVQKVRPEGVGIIVRTASEGVDDEKIAADIEFLGKLWESIYSKAAKIQAPSLVHEDLNLVFRATRDLMSKDLDRIVIDNKDQYQELVRFLNRFSIKLGAQVHLYQGEDAIFDAFGIEMEIQKALGKKVWLKSGGYLIIEQTEALTAIDVNTGRFVGTKSLGDTIARTNMEAVREIVFQLRLRNIGGIIILDFIDMEKMDDRERVFQYLVEELKKDKARTTALRISEMGLVQMTRKRTEESITQKLCVSCPYCEGKGSIKSNMTISYEIIRELYREGQRDPDSVGITVNAHPEVTDRLLEQDRPFFNEVQNKIGKKIVVKSEAEFHRHHYEINSMHLPGSGAVK